MRILTNSPGLNSGLIKVIEAEEYSPQNVFFCIPIDEIEAREIVDITDFNLFFERGITTRIKIKNRIETISLKYDPNLLNIFGIRNKAPKFSTIVADQRIDFHLSKLNFENCSFENDLAVKYFYDGMEDELIGKRFVLLEPDWDVLDKLFLDYNILFTDWNE